jgi:hypothetical protein
VGHRRSGEHRQSKDDQIEHDDQRQRAAHQEEQRARQDMMQTRARHGNAQSRQRRRQHRQRQKAEIAAQIGKHDDAGRRHERGDENAEEYQPARHTLRPVRRLTSLSPRVAHGLPLTCLAGASAAS